jgi:ferredoxin
MKKLLRLDPIACDGHGLCAELFPEWISLDDWGYPIINPREVPPGLEEHARRAIKECPKLALRFATQPAGSSINSST